MNWKAYEEINFGNDIIYRWVREGEEYVSRITLEQMDEFESKIRQQQAEIEALKKEAALQRLSDFTQEADNEPVAWRNLCVSNIGEDSEWIYNEIGQGEPLYTHPAKTLTDEEIWAIASEIEHIDLAYGVRLSNELNVLDFARAILRKAQQK